MLYEEPSDAYVADFLGVSNLMDADVVRPGADAADSVTSPVSGRPCRLRIGDFEIDATCGSVGSTGAVRLAIRPERVQLGEYGNTGPEPGSGDGRATRVPRFGHPGLREARSGGVAAGTRAKPGPSTALFARHTGERTSPSRRASCSRIRKLDGEPVDWRADRGRSTRRRSDCTSRSGTQSGQLRPHQLSERFSLLAGPRPRGFTTAKVKNIAREQEPSARLDLAKCRAVAGQHRMLESNARLGSQHGLTEHSLTEHSEFERTGANDGRRSDLGVRGVPEQ